MTSAYSADTTKPVREAGLFAGLRHSLSALGRDVVLGWRRLKATPLFTAFAVLSLGLGIGVTTAAYSAMYTLGARPSGVLDEDRVALLTNLNALRPHTQAYLSWADYQDFSTQQRNFSDVVAWADVRGVLVGRASSVRVSVEAVGGRYFSMLGVRPAVGRALVPDDDRLDAPPVMVLSDLIWRRQFDADPGIVGTTVRFAQQTFEIVGVAPTSFRGATSSSVSDVTAWVPLATATRVTTSPNVTFNPSRRDARWLSVLGRLRPSAAVEAAAIDVATIAGRLDGTAPLPAISTAPQQPAVQPRRGWGATPLDETSNLLGSEGVRLAVGLPFLVFLIACTNLTNLVLSRASSRRHEVAVRGALGASRWRLLREQLTETAMIAAAGGLLGALVAHGLLTATVSMLREPIESTVPGLFLVWRLEPVVFIAAGVGSLIAMLVAGLVPAVQMTRVNVGRALTIGDPSAAAPRWRWRSNIIAVQVGVSTGLFLITVIAVRFLIIDGPVRQLSLERVAVAAVTFEPRSYTADRTGDIATDIVERTRRLPNVAAASAATGLPIAAPGLTLRSTVEVTPSGRPFPAQEASQDVPAVIAAMPGLDAAMGLELLAGRFVEDADRGRGVALDAGAANILFGSTNVVGRDLRIRHRGPGPDAPRIETTRTVVGVVSTLSQPAEREARRFGALFIPFMDRASSGIRTPREILFVARASTGDARGLVTQLRTAVRQVDPDLAINRAGRADLLVAGPMLFGPFLAAAFGSLATLGLALAMAGLYGVLSQVVGARRSEMGLRLALGAGTRGIVALVVRQGMRPVIEGLLIGLGVALVLRQVLQMGMTETLSSVNVPTFALAAVPLVVAGLIAVYLPARRASLVDPLTALRHE